MSKVRADNFTNRAADGAPTFTNGATVTGVVTATSGSFGSVIATSGSFSGNVSIGGTLAYEDVTNVDVTGIITANNGIKVVDGGISVIGGGLDVTGGNVSVVGLSSLSTVTTGVLTPTETRISSVSEIMKVGTGVSVTIDFDAGDGNIGIVRVPSGIISLYVNDIPTFNNRAISLTVVAVQGSTGYACTTVYFNGTQKTVRYPGGTVPGAGTSCVDYYNFVGIDTVGDGAISSYTVTGNLNGDYRFY